MRIVLIKMKLVAVVHMVVVVVVACALGRGSARPVDDQYDYYQRVGKNSFSKPENHV